MIASLATLEERMVGALKVVLGIGLIALVLLNVANAAGRYGGFPMLSGMDELLVYGMIWLVMVGAVIAARDRTHISINLLPTSLGEAGSRVLQLLISVIMATVCAVIAWHSWAFIERIASIGQKSMGLGIPMVIPHTAILVGFAGMALVCVALVLLDLRAATTRREG